MKPDEPPTSKGTVVSADEMQAILTNHETFYGIAHRHYQEVLRLVEDRNSRTVKTDDDVDFVSKKNAEIQADAMIVVVFAALTLEAFINDYGIEKFSMPYFLKHLDRHSTVKKWAIIPRKAVGKEIATDGQAYDAIRKVFALRHKLVHYKSGKKKISDLSEQEDWITEDHAKMCYEAVELAVNALQAVDVSVESRWLNDARVEPFH